MAAIPVDPPNVLPLDRRVAAMPEDARNALELVLKGLEAGCRRPDAELFKMDAQRQRLEDKVSELQAEVDRAHEQAEEKHTLEWFTLRMSDKLGADHEAGLLPLGWQ